jgi:hypothetical protein
VRTRLSFVSFAEPLEPRRLASAAGPTPVDVRVVGNPSAATAIRVTFDRPLDPSVAQRADNYGIARVVEKCFHFDNSHDGSGSFTVCGDERRSPGVVSAAYDDATRSVLLTAGEPFSVTRRMRVVRVNAEGRFGVTDPAGNRLDGDGDGRAGDDAVFRVVYGSGRAVSYTETDGDRVTLRVQGPGKIFLMRRAKNRKGGKGEALQLWVSGEGPEQTAVTGTVRAGRSGDGKGTIGEVIGASSARLEILTDPAFVVGEVTP